MIRSSAVGTALFWAILSASSPSAQGIKASRAHFATLTSDQPDYEPDTIAVLVGMGFVPQELVTLQVLHADGSPSTGADHLPWTVIASSDGRFVTRWHVCVDDCVGQWLQATAVGASSGVRATTTFSDNRVCGTGIVVSVTAVGGSCIAYTPAGAGADHYDVAEGGTYTMTIDGVTECTGDTITVFVQNSSTGNFCFNATGANGLYSGTFTVPSPTCNTMPVRYKCGASVLCSHSNSLAALGLSSGTGGVQLRAANFDGSCNKTSYRDCAGPTPTGACCLVDGSCVEVTVGNCAARGGTFHGFFSTCVQVSCAPAVGACCLSDGSCVQISGDDCATLDGTYHGDLSTCKDVSCPPPSGACCLADGSCVEVTEEDCASQGGVFHGDSTHCGQVNCPPPPPLTGACCLSKDLCVEITEAECAFQGGLYHGNNTHCTDVGCSDLFPECFFLDFTTDDEVNPLAHGTKVDTEFDGGPAFPVTITSSVNFSGQATAAILNSTTGPAFQDPDLLVGKGNILVLQTDADLSECPPASGIYCTHNDDENGGRISFAFNVPVNPASIVLVDIDSSDPMSTLVLTDANNRTRTYTVPGNWTGDKVANSVPGYRTLDLTTLANQPGYGSTATASEQVGFDSNAVLRIDVHLGGSGGLDDLFWCQ